MFLKFLRQEVAPPPTAAPALPLGADEFARLMEPFALAPGTPLALAVSGGPDSMALALCAKEWRRKNPGELVAFIVDHGLRAEAGAEARRTAEVLAALGIEAEILRWEHPPVLARLHETARRARYRLLIDACKKRGIGHLLLAHQREDQAETILMRLAKGSGIGGLGGMRAENLADGVRLVRPLLSVPKARLEAVCRAAHVAFAADPSNASAKYARGRLRRVMPLLAEEGLTVERLADLGARAAEAADALDHYAAMLLRVATKLDAAGVVRIGLDHFRTAPRATALLALSECLQSVHREDYAPERAPLADLLDALCGDGETPARTLHGCLISKAGSEAAVMREFSAISEAVKIVPGESATWDGRWLVTLDKNAGQDFEIRALGNPPHEELDRLAPGLRARIPQGRARAALPSLWSGGVLALLPALPQLPVPGPARARLLASWPPVPGTIRW